MSDYLNISLMKKIWGYLSKQIPDNKPDVSKLQNIIEPLCCVIKLSILSYYPIGTKISIQNNTIEFVKPTALQGTIRWSSGDKREDLHYLHNPLVKAAEWYQPLVKHNKGMTTLFLLAIDGLKLLKKSYSSSSTLICHSLDSYCDILRKCLKIIPTSPISIKNSNFFKLKDEQLKKVLDKVDNKKKMLTRSQKKLNDSLKNSQDNINPQKSLTFSNTEIHIHQDNSITSSLSTDEREYKEEKVVNMNEVYTTEPMKNTTVLGKQLKSMWTKEKINIIINLFKELEKDKENKKYYLSSITNLVHIVEKRVTDLLFNVRTFQDTGNI